MSSGFFFTVTINFFCLRCQSHLFEIIIFKYCLGSIFIDFSCTHTFSGTHSFSKYPLIVKFSWSFPFCCSGSHHNSSPLTKQNMAEIMCIHLLLLDIQADYIFQPPYSFTQWNVDKGDSCMSLQYPASRNLSYKIFDLPYLYSANEWRY